MILYIFKISKIIIITNMIKILSINLARKICLKLRLLSLNKYIKN